MHRPEPALVAHLDVRDLVRRAADQLASMGVGGDLIGGGDDRVHVLGVGHVATLRAVAHEHAVGVDDGQGRLDELRQIRDGNVDVLVKPVAPAAVATLKPWLLFNVKFTSIPVVLMLLPFT